MKNIPRLGLIGLGVLALVAGAYLWWQSQHSAPPAVVAPGPIVVPTPQVAAPAPPAVPPISHPIDPLPAQASDKPPASDTADAQAERALVGLVGRKAALSFFQLNDLVHRCVATVDGLARGHAASRLWPVLPTPQRFLVTENSQGTSMDERNADRYTPFVKFATAIDPAAAASAYRRLYPLFQKAHEELGYPGQYFNDRLVLVIDQLLETPLSKQALQLTLTKIQSPYAAPSPWLRYEFADPNMESRPAGQKILIRMGYTNASQLQAWLTAFRTHIATKQAVK